MNGNTLTDRYVHEAVRRMPEDQRDDVGDELRGSITDSVEALTPTARSRRSATCSPRSATRTGWRPATPSVRSP